MEYVDLYLIHHPISMRPPAAEGGLCPLVVKITGFGEVGEPLEDEHIRTSIDEFLRRENPKRDVGAVASTIFPNALWRPGVPRGRLFERYLRMLPRLRRYPGNHLGLYFERMIAFSPQAPHEGNQLDFIIESFSGGLRRNSAFQIVIADPSRDHSRAPRRGFPCLQQVAVAPDEGTGTLCLTAFYATQYVIERAYGNYLGLARLGRFLAHEMGLRFSAITCVASRAVLGVSKERARALLTDINDARSGRSPFRLQSGTASSRTRLAIPSSMTARAQGGRGDRVRGAQG